MSLKVTKVELGNEFNSIKTNWLKHLKGEKIDFRIDFLIDTWISVFSNTDDSNTLTYFPDNKTTGDWIQFEKGCLQDYNVGDTITIDDETTPANDGDYIIVEKQDNSTIRISGTGVPFTNQTTTSAVINVKDIFTVDKVKFRFGLIENNEAINYFSKTDENIQELNASALLYTNIVPTTMIAAGQKSWQICDAQIAGAGLDADGNPTFSITGHLTLTPFILPEQFDDTQNGIPPDYFADFNCLKFVYRIEASYINRSPYINQNGEFSEMLGDSGWQKEQFNNRPTNYTLDSIVLKDVNSNTITKLIATTDEQSFTAVIKNTTDTPFTTSTKFLVQFYIVPESYKNNGNNLAYNFRQDRALQIVGAASINGDQYGVTGRQVLKTIAATLDSSSQITITGKIDLHSNLVAFLKTLNKAKYVLEIITGNSFGGNLIINGDFPTNLSSWTVYNSANITWNSGKARFVNLNGATHYLGQTVSWTIGKKYRLEFDISNWSSGDAIARIQNGGATKNTTISANGHYSVDSNALGFASSEVAFLGGGVNANFDLDNVVVTEIVDNSLDIRVLLPLSEQEFLVNEADYSTLITENSQTFIEHPYQDKANGIDNVRAFTEDEIVNYTKIKFDLSKSDYAVSIKTIRAGVRAKNSSTLASFDIDAETCDFSTATIVNSLEYMNYIQERPFKMPTTELAKNFTVQRLVSSDSGNLRYYEVYFPFLARWEYWESNPNVNAAFFDASKTNNGLNQQWSRFQDVTNWNLYSFVEVTTIINGIEKTTTFENKFYVDEYDENVDWGTPTIQTFDGANQLINGGDEYILTDADTSVQVEWTWSGSGSRPDGEADEVCVVLYLNTFEQGGVTTRTRISSARAKGTESQWKSQDSSDKVIVSNISTTKILAEADIDYTKLPANAKFTITARIYDKRDLQS